MIPTRWTKKKLDHWFIRYNLSYVNPVLQTHRIKKYTRYRYLITYTRDEILKKDKDIYSFIK